jgi:fatty-acyl-CoA synthase
LKWPNNQDPEETAHQLKPGSGELRVCNGGMFSLSAIKIEKKRAPETFKTFNGVRYSIPGYAKVETDGGV